MPSQRKLLFLTVRMKRKAPFEFKLTSLRSPLLANKFRTKRGFIWPTIIRLTRALTYLKVQVRLSVLHVYTRSIIFSRTRSPPVTNSTRLAARLWRLSQWTIIKLPLETTNGISKLLKPVRLVKGLGIRSQVFFQGCRARNPKRLPRAKTRRQSLGLSRGKMNRQRRWTRKLFYIVPNHRLSRKLCLLSKPPNHR